MPEVDELLSWIDLELALRDADRKDVEAPRYDWYGPPCGCPEGSKNEGSCPLHPRARAKQRPPEGPWQVWYLECGRGFGKTLTLNQWVRWKVETKQARQIALVGPTAADVRDVMVDGPTGLLQISPPWYMPVYQPSKRRLVWPDGQRAYTYSADEPERLRGPQHDLAACDEVAAWRLKEAWDMLMFGLRLGKDPQCGVATTPKPRDWLRTIKGRATTRVVRGSSYENRPNLARSFFDTIIRPFEGTRLGRQELEAEDLQDTPGALWTTELLDACRIDQAALPPLTRIIVGVDPTVGDPGTSDDIAECGIVVGGYADLAHPTLGRVRHGYKLADRTVKGHPSVWGRAVVNAYREFRADKVVAEVNNGGVLVAENIRAVDRQIPVKVVHASRGKLARAEPIATLYEQRRVFHVRGADLAELEREMCTYVPGGRSPNRMDAAVWADTEGLTAGTPLVVGGPLLPGWRG